MRELKGNLIVLDNSYDVWEVLIQCTTSKRSYCFFFF